MFASQHAKQSIAYSKLSHISVFIVGVYFLQTNEILFDPLAEGFGVLDRMPRHEVFDKMCTVVGRIGSCKLRQVSIHFAALAGQFLFERGSHNLELESYKGEFEKNVQDGLRRFWQPMPAYSICTRSMPCSRNALPRFIVRSCMPDFFGPSPISGHGELRA